MHDKSSSESEMDGMSSRPASAQAKRPSANDKKIAKVKLFRLAKALSVSVLLHCQACHRANHHQGLQGAS